MQFPAYRARNRFWSLLTSISIRPTATPSKVEKLHQRPPERLRERSQRPCPSRPRTDPSIEMTVRSAKLCGSPELLEPDSQPIPIGTILKPSRPVDQCPAIPFRPSSRKGPSWISSSRSETWNSVIGRRRRSGGRRRPHDGFSLWETVYGPEPAEEPLPGTLRAWV